MVTLLLLLGLAGPAGLASAQAEDALTRCLTPVVRAALRQRQPAEAFRPVFDAACRAESERLEAAEFAHMMEQSPNADTNRGIASRHAEEVRARAYQFYERYMAARPYE